MNTNYSYLFDEVISTATTRELAKKMIPVLVRWVKEGVEGKQYGDLSTAIGHSTPRIGHQLGAVHTIIDALSNAIKEDIPTLNARITSKGTSLPSDGFDYVFPNYSNLSTEQKYEVVRLLNDKAHNYKKWDYVLGLLGLNAEVSEDDVNEIRSGKAHGYGGESERHKMLKEYVANHPSLFGVKEKGVLEHILLSGDRLDVWFPISRIAVEVKPKNDPDSDILRGLFQCVKYKSVLNAESAIAGEYYDYRVILVTEDGLSESNLAVQDTLGIEVKTLSLK